jgi:hypothetical protein
MTQNRLSKFNRLSGTTKRQRNKGLKTFWFYLDKNPETGNIVRRWKRNGCDPTNIAITIQRYVLGYSSRLNAQRKERGRVTKRTLLKALSSLRDLAKLYRSYGQLELVASIENDRKLVRRLLSKTGAAFSTKRLGISRSWSDLAMIEGFVFEATRERPTPKDLVLLIKAGREAHGQKPDPWETNPVNIRKGLKTFKKNNPVSAPLWTNPSHMF